MESKRRKNLKKRVKNIVMDIIEESMKDLPGIRWITGNDPAKICRKTRVLGAYIFESSWNRNGILLSRDRSGLAVLLHQNSLTRNKINPVNAAHFVLRCTGLRRAMEIVKRENYIKKQHPKKRDYLYFWIYAVKPEARGFNASVELKDKVLQESDHAPTPPNSRPACQQKMRRHRH